MSPVRPQLCIFNSNEKKKKRKTFGRLNKLNASVQGI